MEHVVDLSRANCQLVQTVGKARDGETIVVAVEEQHRGMGEMVAGFLRRHLSSEHKRVSVEVRPYPAVRRWA